MMNLHEALCDIDIAFRQLEFAIKLLSYSENGEIVAGKFDSDHTVILDGGNIRLPTGYFSTSDNIIRAANVYVSLASGATALVLDKAFEVAGVKQNFASDDIIGKIRILIYMVRCAYAHGIADPCWAIKAKYHRILQIEFDDVSISLDLKCLHDQRFDFEQIGGYCNWYRIRDLLVREFKSMKA
jgi:hypothetical protein